VPSDAGTYVTLRTRWHVLTDPLSPSHSLTVLKAPRSQSKTQLSSAHYSRTSRHSHKFPPFSKPTKTSGALHIRFPPSPPSLTQLLLHSPNAQVTARVNNARLLAAQPKDLPPARRTRAARAGRSDAHRDGGRARGGQADPDGRGTRTSGRTGRRAGSSLDTTRTRRSSGGGPLADVTVSRRSLVLAIVAPTEAVPG